jgi:hypothetical protein
LSWKYLTLSFSSGLNPFPALDSMVCSWATLSQIYLLWQGPLLGCLHSLPQIFFDDMYLHCSLFEFICLLIGFFVQLLPYSPSFLAW